MILETKSLLLREMIPDDFQALLRVLGDPETMCHYSVIIQHLLELLMIQSDKLAYLTDLSGSRGRTSGETALSAHSEEHEVF